MTELLKFICRSLWEEIARVEGKMSGHWNVSISYTRYCRFQCHDTVEPLIWVTDNTFGTHSFLANLSSIGRLSSLGGCVYWSYIGNSPFGVLRLVLYSFYCVLYLETGVSFITVLWPTKCFVVCWCDDLYHFLFTDLVRNLDSTDGRWKKVCIVIVATWKEQFTLLQCHGNYFFTLLDLAKGDWTSHLFLHYLFIPLLVEL